jgi:hypothetical protein
MLNILAVLSILCGIFVLSFVFLGARNDGGLWLTGLVFLAPGVAWFGWGVIQENKRKQMIELRRSEWGDEICSKLLSKKIAPEMSSDMVKLGWGSPSKVDERETTKNGVKERWVYGRPRRGANYVWFTNGKVSKIKT